MGNMGGCVPSQEARTGNKRNLVIIGLDGSGTTTILYQIAFQGHLQTIPTMSINHEKAEYGQFSYELYDVGGLEKFRPVWRHFFGDADGIVFAIDAANRNRFEEARRELAKVFAEEKSGRIGPKRKRLAKNAPNVPLLIFANKQDVKNAASAEEVEEALNCKRLPVKCYKVVECCAKNGDRINEGLDWMNAQLEKHALTSTSGR